MNILITGCNGQLGNELQLLEAKYQQHTFFNTDVNELDITNQLAVDDYVFRNQIDCVINCAAYTAVDKAEEQKELCTTLNTVAPSYLAAAVEKRGGCMIQISTDYVFDGTHSTPYVETDTPAPNSVYGCTKLAGELGVTKFCKKSIVIRTAWLYSTFGNNFVKTMLRLGRERKELGVVADQIGSPTYAADLAAAIMTIVEKGVKPGVYHYTNEGVASWYDFTKAIHRMAGIKDCNVKPIHTSDYPTAATRPAYSVLDKKKITDDYQLTIPHWEEALQRCMDSLLNQ
ncbi:MAG: dTDP-4-dehydrorhamnose reductase [Prevotella sp.]|nr:dTDP-4-dehydrorhamnose reductase [Prevotella sp.]